MKKGTGGGSGKKIRYDNGCGSVSARAKNRRNQMAPLQVSATADVLVDRLFDGTVTSGVQKG